LKGHGCECRRVCGNWLWLWVLTSVK